MHILLAMRAKKIDFFCTAMINSFHSVFTYYKITAV